MSQDKRNKSPVSIRMQSESDFRFDMDDSFNFRSQQISSPSTTVTRKATAWPVDLAASAEALLRYPQASISSFGPAVGFKRRHSSSDIRKNAYPSEQYTPSKTTGHYTISRDCTAGFEVRKMQLFADFGKKCQGGKNHFGHSGNMRLGPGVTYRHTDATEKKVALVADSGHARSHNLSPVVDRNTIYAQQLSQKIVYYPRSRNNNIYVPNRTGKAESPFSKEARDIGEPCRLCGYIPQCDTRHFETYMAKHMKSLHQEIPYIFLCPYPGCTEQFSRLDNMRRHLENASHDVEDEDLGTQKRQRVR